ncbi:MAG: glutathione S-transferase family protein [Pseudomonadota bacterium]
MKLYTAPATPFGRTVEMVAHELGVHGDLTIVPTVVAPTKQNEDYRAVAPLRKIPALQLDDGSVITDSPLICEYLAYSAGNTSLFASGTVNEWPVKAAYAVARGMADCGVALRYETFLRPEALRWDQWIADQKLKLMSGVEYFAARVLPLSDTVTVADLSLAAALGYIDFRFSSLNWREGRAELAQWFAGMEGRASFRATKPD